MPLFLPVPRLESGDNEHAVNAAVLNSLARHLHVSLDLL
jgi:hypothetical protein